MASYLPSLPSILSVSGEVYQYPQIAMDPDGFRIYDFDKITLFIDCLF